jgi:prostaglandin-endoperoxide synthase 2
MSVLTPMEDASSGQTAPWGATARIVPWALTHFGWFWRLAQRSGPLERLVNRTLINHVVNSALERPYALSAKADYTSWDSLTDQSYNARQLPPRYGSTQPAADDVAALFARTDKMIPCPKSTVMFAYVAQWFTDGVLRSGRVTPPAARDITRNESNNEVDLGQLYGLRPEVTDALRAKHGGLLKSRGEPGAEFPPLLCAADGTTLPEFAALDPVIGIGSLTPAQRSGLFAMGSDAANTQIGYASINVLFLREHNRIARALARAYPSWDDERLFATARNILTVLLIKLVIEEYINHIAPYHFQFTLQPGSFRRSRWMRPNWVAVEFNLLYRWHSLLPSALDVRGAQLPIADTLYRGDLLTAHDIGPLFEDASRQPAGRIGLHNTDAWFGPRTTLQSVGQSRSVNLPPYNDYRVAVKLPPKTSFEQISSHPETRRRLRELYGRPEHVEFFVGIFAEDTPANAVLPELMGILVGLHAFSQLMTNPLLAPQVYNERTFSPLGMDLIKSTGSLAELVNRNVPAGSPEYFVSMTQAGWQRRSAAGSSPPGTGGLGERLRRLLE